jgi:hypothetical protein
VGLLDWPFFRKIGVAHLLCYFTSCKKTNIETGRGCWKSLAAAPLEVGYMRF